MARMELMSLLFIISRFSFVVICKKFGCVSDRASKVFSVYASLMVI